MLYISPITSSIFIKSFGAFISTFLYSIFQVFSNLKLISSFSHSFILNKILALFFQFFKSLSISNFQITFSFLIFFQKFL